MKASASPSFLFAPVSVSGASFRAPSFSACPITFPAALASWAGAGERPFGHFRHFYCPLQPGPAVGDVLQDPGEGFPACQAFLRFPERRLGPGEPGWRQDFAPVLPRRSDIVFQEIDLFRGTFRRRDRLHLQFARTRAPSQENSDGDERRQDDQSSFPSHTFLLSGNPRGKSTLARSVWKSVYRNGMPGWNAPASPMR